MTAYFIHQHQSRAMEPRRPGRNAKHNYPLRLTAPILANYYVENVQIGNIQMTVQKPASVIKRQVKDAIKLLETVCVMTNMVERIVLAIHQ